MYLPSTEIAKIIRSELKKVGYSSRMVSVRSNSCAIHCEIKDKAVDKALVEKIAIQHEDIDYDQYTGEILSGGNTYVFVQYAYGIN